jgi:hypothetical protein
MRARASHSAQDPYGACALEAPRLHRNKRPNAAEQHASPSERFNLAAAQDRHGRHIIEGADLDRTDQTDRTDRTGHREESSHVIRHDDRGDERHACDAVLDQRDCGGDGGDGGDGGGAVTAARAAHIRAISFQEGKEIRGGAPLPICPDWKGLGMQYRYAAEVQGAQQYRYAAEVQGAAV